MALGAAAGLTACSEDNTLSGATEVYIEIAPSDFNIHVGEKVAVTATVTNVSGDIIDTPVEWSVDDADVLTLKGDTVMAVPGAQGRSTKLRAKLENGKEALTHVNVVNHDGSDIVCEVERKRTYSQPPIDTVWFTVEPAGLLRDYTPVVTGEVTERYNGDGEFEFPTNELGIPGVDMIDYENGRVRVTWRCPRIGGKGRVILSLGDEHNSYAGSVDLDIYPVLVPGLFDKTGKRPPVDAISPDNGTRFIITKQMDINSTDTVRVSVGVQGYAAEDIANATNVFRWEIEGSDIIPYDQQLHVDSYGYIAELYIRSGIRTGTSVVRFVYPDSVLVANIIVDDYVRNHPVEKIIVANEDNIHVYAGATTPIDVTVEPESSFEYHIPVVTSNDESIVTVDPRKSTDGTTYTIRGVRPGTATLTIKSLDKTKVVNVTVEDRVNQVLWAQGNPTSALVGETAEISAVVQMTSGLPTTMPVTWRSSDENIASVAAKPGSLETAIVTAKEVGEVDIWAECGGLTVTSPLHFRVIQASNITADGATHTASIYESGEPGYMAFEIFDADYNSVVYFEFPGYNNDENFAGHFVGPGNGLSVIIGTDTFDVADYDVTITATGGEEEYTITGVIRLTSGVTITINSVTGTVEWI